MKQLINRIKDWGHWPSVIFYFPLSFVWIWYCIKSKSLWFFSSSNPTLTFGGFEGESKSEMYDQLSSTLYPQTIYIEPDTTTEELLITLSTSSFTFPFIVKPDIGMKGLLFRKIDNETQLINYHRQMFARYIIQQFVDMPFEVSVFYYRYPNSISGHISAFIQKNLLTITGNGHSTINEIISTQKNTIPHPAYLSKLHKFELNKVLKQGKTFILSLIANRIYGANFINLTHLISEKMLTTFDFISNHPRSFYYGRYDIKCASIEDMIEGKNFTILEFNGAGAIPNHIYANGYTIMKAYKEISKHWEVLYKISKYNNSNRVPYWGFFRGCNFLRKTKIYFRALEKCSQQHV